MKKEIVILGAGLSGLSTAYFLQGREDVGKILLLEKEERAGGLCRSIHCGDYTYDIGPHILFSKDKEMLALMLSFLDEGQNERRRSNQIIYKKRWIQYPFENDLSKLPDEDLRRCILSFNENPYESYEADNMLQFFLKVFGEGITDIYLRPYNEKIWKYDPVFMDLSMVGRIPKPAKEEIERSAGGETVDGYLHQLYFHYPKTGGIEAVISGLKRRLGEKCELRTSCPVSGVTGEENGTYFVTAGNLQFQADQVISTIPVQELAKAACVPRRIQQHVDSLRYNSIMIFFVKTKVDRCGNHFAFMIPDKDIIFHRISKMDFLGEAYHSYGAAYMAELTYRKGDYYDRMEDEKLKELVVRGICEIGFAAEKEEVQVLNLTRHPYAYVVYDLRHRENVEAVRKYFREKGIILNGRFGNFEYWNMDRILRESYNVSKELSREG